MLEKINSIFYEKIDENKSIIEIIDQIEGMNQRALDYIEKNSTSEKQKKSMKSYVAVLFSRTILSYVRLKQYADYINDSKFNNEEHNIKTLKPHK